MICKGKIAKYILILLLFFFTASAQLSYAQESSKTNQYQAEIVDSKHIEIVSGPLKGKKYEVNFSGTQKGQNISYKKGDKVIVAHSKEPGGKEIVYIVDYVRTQALVVLLAVFLLFVFAIGRLKGITSFAGMVFSFFIISNLIVKNIIVGNDPILMTLFGALFIIPVTFYLAHGINTKATIAVLSTFISLILTAGLAFLFVYMVRLTGFAAEEAVYVANIKETAINIRSLLLAGIIIGAMGVLDDITISQASIVERLAHAQSSYNFRELYRESMKVGRDHIASLVNTLVLVYTGASLPLLLLFYQSGTSFFTVINHEIVATEIVRTLVSSIGIIAAVPISSLMAAYYFSKRK